MLLLTELWWGTACVDCFSPIIQTYLTFCFCFSSLQSCCTTPVSVLFTSASPWDLVRRCFAPTGTMNNIILKHVMGHYFQLFWCVHVWEQREEHLQCFSWCASHFNSCSRSVIKKYTKNRLKEYVHKSDVCEHWKRFCLLLLILLLILVSKTSVMCGGHNPHLNVYLELQQNDNSAVWLNEIKFRFWGWFD